MAKKKVLLKDIAKEAGVSTALVSYVLNGLEKEKRVGKEIVEKIIQIANDLDYQPNQIARSLRSGKTNTIGLIIADISNPFSGQIARIIENEATKLGYKVIMGSSDENNNKFSSLIDSLLNRQVDGFILAPPEGSEEQVNNLFESSIPFVLIDRYFPSIPGNHVVLNNFNSTFDTVEFLISGGRKNICLIIYKSTSFHMQQRVIGYQSAMKENGLEDNITIIEIPRKDYSQIKKDVEKKINTLLNEKKMDGLIFGSNILSVYGLYALKSIDLKVPEDIAVIGFDGHEVFDFFEPQLSFIKQPLEEIGAEAVRILLNQIKGSNSIVHTEVQYEFIKRGSSG